MYVRTYVPRNLVFAAFMDMKHFSSLIINNYEKRSIKRTFGENYHKKDGTEKSPGRCELTLPQGDKQADVISLT